MIRGYRFNTVIFMEAAGLPEDHEMYGFGSYNRNHKKSEFKCVQFQNYRHCPPEDCLDEESCEERGCCYCFWVNYPIYYSDQIVEINEQKSKRNEGFSKR